MLNLFINSFLSEWLKRKRTASNWLIYIGALMAPLVYLIVRIVKAKSDTFVMGNASPKMWLETYNFFWQLMSSFLLPMIVIMVTSLIAQIEFKNNTWKQVVTTPQPLFVVFFTKLGIVMTLLLQYFILLNIGIYLAVILPSVFTSLPFPVADYPFEYVLKNNFKFFIDILPIIAIQFLISMQFRNFLGPVGIGLGIYIASSIAIFWKYGYIVPYTYPTYNFLGKGSHVYDLVNIHILAVTYFVVFTALGYFLFANKKEKG